MPFQRGKQVRTVDGAAIEFLDASHDAQLPHEQIDGRRIAAPELQFQSLEVAQRPNGSQVAVVVKMLDDQRVQRGQHLSSELGKPPGTRSPGTTSFLSVSNP